jgi:hypothetical protein
MTGAIQDERVVEFVDRYLAFLTEGGDEPNLDALEEPLRGQALQYLRALDLLDADEEYPMPALADDPIARKFGWDRPDETVTISTAALKQATQSAGMSAQQLAQKLTAAGKPTRLEDLLRFAKGTTATIDSDLAARLAAILHTSVPSLEAPNRVPTATGSLDEVLQSAKERIAELAKKFGKPFEAVEGSLREQLVAVAFRNQSEEGLREALDVVLKDLEREQRR